MSIPKSGVISLMIKMLKTALKTNPTYINLLLVDAVFYEFFLIPIIHRLYSYTGEKNTFLQ